MVHGEMESLVRRGDMARRINMNGRIIGQGERCFIIAEAGVNHNGDIKLALRLVEAAARAGADAVKFQLYNIDEQVSPKAKTVGYQQERTGVGLMAEMANFYDLPWEAHREIAEYCRESDIMYMSSCFDKKAVDFLLYLGCECIKVGSGEITNFPLLSHMSSSGKPILLSTGMSELSEIAQAVEHIRTSGESPIALFHCVSSYPAAHSSVNLKVMETLVAAFGVPVGFSDHTIGNEISCAAVALGASLIEKHFTLDKELPGPDHAMSLNPDELRSLVEGIRNVESAMGGGLKKVQENEQENRIAARRGLVSTCDISSGDILSEANSAFKRPAIGIDPRFYHVIAGRRVNRSIQAHEPITWDMLS